MTDETLKKIERKIIRKLTDELVKLAKYPILDRTFTFAIDSNHICEFYKDNPKMSNIENIVLAYCHIVRLQKTDRGEDVPSLMDRIEELLASINDVYDYASVAVWYYEAMYIYLCELNDMEAAFEYCRKWLATQVETIGGANKDAFDEYLCLLEQMDKKWQLIDIIKDCDAYVSEQIQILKENRDYDEYVSSIVKYVYSKKALLDEEDTFVLKAILQINHIIQRPKCKKNKKGSFDYNYAKAEKGEREYQLLVSKAYRTGDGVPKNIRLANLWEKLANSKTC